MDKWYYKVFGDAFGPVTTEELIALVKCQGISVDDEVRFGENGEWCLVSAIDELVQQVPQKSKPASTPRTSPPPAASAPVTAPVPINVPVPVNISPPVTEARTDIQPNAEAWPRPEMWAAVEAWPKVEAPPQPLIPPTQPGTAASTAEIVCYYKIFGVEYGPVKFEQLIDLAKTQTIYKNDEIRFVELGPWHQAGSIDELTTDTFLQFERPAFAWNDPNAAYGQMGGAGWQTANTAHGSNTANGTPDAGSLWWCKIRGVDYGPVDSPKVAWWGETGVLGPTDLVRRGNGEFIVASEMPGLIPKSPRASAFQDKSTPTKTPQVEMEEASDPELESDSEETPRTVSEPRSKSATPRRSTAATETGAGVDYEPLLNSIKQLALRAAIVLVAIGLMAGVIYAVLPVFTETNRFNVARLIELQDGLKEIQQLRGKKGVTNRDLKQAAKNLESLASSVEKETAGSRTANRKAIRSLAKTVLVIAEQEDLTKRSPAEKAADQLITKLKARFGVP